MFAAFALLQVKTGRLAAFKALMLEWMQPGARLPRGFISAEPYQSTDDPNRIMMSVVFASHESFVTSTGGIESDEAYQRMSSLIEGSLDWQDADIG